MPVLRRVFHRVWSTSTGWSLQPTGAHDSLIGPVLVALACAGDAPDARLLDEEIRRHLGTAAARLPTMGLAEHLVTWWADKESRITRD